MFCNVQSDRKIHGTSLSIPKYEGLTHTPVSWHEGDQIRHEDATRGHDHNYLTMKDQVDEAKLTHKGAVLFFISLHANGSNDNITQNNSVPCKGLDAQCLLSCDLLCASMQQLLERTTKTAQTKNVRVHLEGIYNI